MTAASNSEARKRGADLARDLFNTAHDNARTARAVAVVERELIANGARADEGIHSWRCSYPDLYGPCECLNETSTDVVVALRAEGLLA